MNGAMLMWAISETRSIHRRINREETRHKVLIEDGLRPGVEKPTVNRYWAVYHDFGLS